jgi:probable F420-dependent oxidoreductase
MKVGIYALAAAASTTERITIGTSVSLVLQHDPIILAKTIASLDVLSQGRFLLGVGVGWNVEEMANHGVDPARRGQHIEETIEALRTIWREDEATFKGDLIDFERIWSWPKPHEGRQIGCNSRAAMRRAARTSSGWLPYLDRTEGWLEQALRELEEVAAVEGTATPPVTLFMAGSKPSELAAYRTLGVDRCLLWVPEGDWESIGARLERYAEAAGTLEG